MADLLEFRVGNYASFRKAYRQSEPGQLDAKIASYIEELDAIDEELKKANAKKKAIYQRIRRDGLNRDAIVAVRQFRRVEAEHNRLSEDTLTQAYLAAVERHHFLD